MPWSLSSGGGKAIFRRNARSEKGGASTIIQAVYMLVRYLQRAPRALLASVLILAIAIVDWRVQADIAFGFLYLLPMLLVGTIFPRWGVVLTALLCTILSDLFDPFPFTVSVGLPQDILVFTSLAGMGLYSF
jgi:hypothetical protein